MACPDCGSWSVKADRGLSGRMVCGRCGRPLGGGARRSWGLPWAGARGNQGRQRQRLPTLSRWLLWLLAAGALLTAWTEQRQPAADPAPQLWRSPDRADPEGKRSAIIFRNIAS